MTVDEYKERIKMATIFPIYKEILDGENYTFKIKRDTMYFQEIIDELFKCYKDIVIHADNAYYAIYVGRTK